jgi:hypothetical protein
VNLKRGTAMSARNSKAIVCISVRSKTSKVSSFLLDSVLRSREAKGCNIMEGTRFDEKRKAGPREKPLNRNEP